MAKTFKLGFIGAGGIAGSHCKHLQDVSGVSIAAAADVNSDALEKFKEKWGAKKLYSDYREMLKKEKLDAVSVCTPNFLHAQPTVDALNAGMHVLVEKPMAMNTAECREMLKAARKNRKKLMVAFQWRFSPNAQFMRKQVKAGVCGDIKYVRVQALRRRGIPSWGVFGKKELQGGGPLIDIGVHIIEMTHYIVGKPKPVACSASTYTYLGNKKPSVKSPWGDWDYKTYNVEDLAVGFIRFDNGMTWSIESSFAAHISKNVWNIQVMGTKAGMSYDPLELNTDSNGYMVNTTPEFIGKDSGFAFKMKHFVEVARDGKPCQSPGRDGMVVQKILDALYESSEKGCEVEIK